MNELIESGNFIGPPGINIKNNDYVVSIPLSYEKETLQIDITPGTDILICEEIKTNGSLSPQREEGHLAAQRYSGPLFENQVKWGNSLWNIYRISPTIVSHEEIKFLGAIFLGEKRLSLWMVPEAKDTKRSKLGTSFTKLGDGKKYSSLV